MIELSAYKFRIYPTAGQDWLFRNTFGCCRLVYNACLEQRRLERHRSEPRRITSFDQIGELKDLKAELQFLKTAPHHALVQAVMDLDRAFKNFFEGNARYPKPRRKFENESFRYPDPKQVKLEKDRIFLPKAGWVRMVMHRAVEGTVKNVTVSRHGTYWYASIQVEREAAEPPPKAGRVEGGDLGVVHAMTVSDGAVYDLPRTTRKEERKEAALRKTVARRKKGSRNHARAQLALKRHLAKAVRRRRDAKHKMTTAIARRYAVFFAEDLKVKNMTASARGTLEEPGTNVAQKAGLNRALLDVAPGETRTQLDYKFRRAGGCLVFVHPAHTSQQCSCCLRTDAANRPDRDRFRCVACGHEDCADLNAAKNIRRKGVETLAAATGGHPGMACGSSRAGGRKQEGKGREAGSPAVHGGE